MNFARLRAVAGKELTVLWSSPVPYVVGALFQGVLAALFVDQLHAREQAVVQPLFPLAGFLLLLTVPIITMRSFAEEARTGTLDLLQAAPVPPSPLVAGKWLAGWLTTLAMLLPTGVLVVIVRWLGYKATPGTTFGRPAPKLGTDGAPTTEEENVGENGKPDIA